VITPFRASPTGIDDLWVIQVKAVPDERGVVRELFRASDLAEAGVPVSGPWRQVNITESGPGAIRGLHGESMDKLVTVAHGSAFGAYLDARAGSPTYGRVHTVELVPGVAVFVPAGVCNGFQATAQGPSQYVYCFTAEWTPDMPGVGVNPLDAALGIEWPIPIDTADRSKLSAKDAGLPPLAR